MDDTTPSSGDAPGRGLRLAFAGVAHWHFFVDARYLELAREAEAQIVGLYDDDEALARRRGEELDCGWTSDLGELIQRFKPDLVVALPRPDRAAEQVGRLLDLGAPLFAEKPLGVRAAETWTLVERAERGWVSVALPQRYQRLWGVLHELRESGKLGTIGHVGLRQYNGPPWRYRQYDVPWMLDPAVAGGGPLRNIGIHLTDSLVRLLGADGLQVVSAAQTNRMHGEPIEDFIAATFLTPDGAVATLETGYSFAAPKPGDGDTRIAGTGAYVIQRREELAVYHADGEVDRYDTAAQSGNGYRTLFFDALRRFRAGESPVATVRDCALASEVIDRIYAAVRTPSRS
jgi:predicted dehydrogenase